MRRLTLVLLASTLLLTGCWDQQPIEELGFVTLAAADGRSGAVDVYVEPILPTKLPQGVNSSGTGGGGSTPSFDLVHGHGQDLYAAVRDADEHSSKRLYFGQFEVLLVSDEAARSGELAGFLDYFVRGTKSRNIAWVYLVRKQEMPKVLQVMPYNASYPAQAIANLSLAQNKLNDRRPIRIFELINRVMTPGKDAAVPVIEPVGSRSFMLGPLGVFRGDRLVGFLSPQGSRGLSRLTGRVETADVTFPLGQLSSIALETARWRRTLGVEFSGGRLTALSVRVQAVLHIGQVSGDVGDLYVPAIRKELLDKAAQEYLTELTAALHETQAYGSDPVGFGAHLRVHYPALWKSLAANWHNTYAQLPIHVAIATQLDDSGMLRGSIHSVQ